MKSLYAKNMLPGLAHLRTASFYSWTRAAAENKILFCSRVRARHHNANAPANFQCASPLM